MEEGTEILFRPEMENILEDHFSFPSQTIKSTEVNLLKYCTTEETVKLSLNQEVLANPIRIKHEVDGNLPSNSSNHPSNGEERQESMLERTCSPATTREQPSHPAVNRYHSLVENATTDEDDEFESDNQVDSSRKNGKDYHPALKAAVYTEGQEAVWHEDEYSTMSSVFVKPEKNKSSTTVKEMLPTRSQKSRKKMKVPFFTSKVNKADKGRPDHNDEEPKPRPVKVYMKKKKIMKSVLLLPPTEANLATKEEIISEDSENEILFRGNERDIVENSIQARRLLDTVLSEDDIDEEDSKRIAKEAFGHAIAARRLAYDHTKKKNMNVGKIDEDETGVEAAEFENILSYLAEEGEQAAWEHRKQCSIGEFIEKEENEGNDVIEGNGHMNTIDITTIEVTESLQVEKKKRRKFPVSGYASRAVHYLESILPKGIGNEKDDFRPDDASNAVDFWSDAGISTLGLKNDTLEYGLNTDEGGDRTNDSSGHDEALLVRNDMMSLSSLNEILDGGGTINEKLYPLENENLNKITRRRTQLTGEPSPRAAIQEIGIPSKKTGLLPSHPRQNRNGILGLMTPITASSNHGNKNNQPTDTENNSSKKWGNFFKTPCSNDAVPIQLTLVMEEKEVIETEGIHRKEIGDCISPYSKRDKENNIESNPSKKWDSGTNNLVKVDSDSNLGMPEGNRYAPAFVDEKCKGKGGRPNRYRPIPQDDEIELKLSIATVEEDKKSGNGGCNDATLVHDLVSSQEKEETCIYTQREQENDLQISSFGKKDKNETRDRYQTEPVGKTPRRDGFDMEENSNRKFKVEERKILEESHLPQFEQPATKNMEKEQVNQTSENFSNQTGLDKVMLQKIIVNKGQACEPSEESNESRKNWIQDEAQLRNTRSEKNAVGSHDGMERVYANLHYPTKSRNDKTNSLAKSEAKIPKNREEELSTARSEGSKTKIFGRVVEFIGRNKRKPLVPIAIVEEKYVGGKDMTKIPSGFKCVIRNPKKSQDDIQCPKPASKSPTNQKAKLNPDTGKASIGHSFNFADDNATTVQEAISNGNLRAGESNEEGDDVVPLNYLSMMLRKRIHEEVRNLGSYSMANKGHSNQQQSLGEKFDPDSSVAVIRGPRHKEAPGIALDEITIRNYQNSRDPCIGNGTGKVRIDLAPTPRHPKGKLHVLYDGDEGEKKKVLDPPMEEEDDERQRRKIITERLFQAGNSTSLDGTNKNEDSENPMKLAPTVESAESYCGGGGNPAKEQENPSFESGENLKSSEISNRDNKPCRRKIGRGRFISFLKGSKRK